MNATRRKQPLRLAPTVVRRNPDGATEDQAGAENETKSGEEELGPQTD
jgi:hypothetical protein